MNEKLPLLKALIDYHKEKNIIFSMPGNKCGKAFERDEIGKYLADNLGRLDITEVEPLDNLHHPEGVIKKSQELLAKFYGVNRAFFMVNGSSGGNLASIFSAFKEGDEVLVERNCHKSIYNALILRKLKVTYIEPVVFGEGGVFLPPDKKRIYEALNKCNNPKGIILTYPNYFGISYRLDEIIQDLKSRGMKIVIDAAHGAHYGVTEKLPTNIASLADYTVVSAHKTIPALTGGSYLLVNDKSEDIEFYMSAFMTTSPSYLIMASLEYARYYLERYGKEDYDELIDIANKVRDKINILGKLKVLSQDDMIDGYEIDLSRYVLTLPIGYSGHKLLEYLRKKCIQSEMSFHLGVVLILSPSNAKEGLNNLYKAIKELDMNLLKDESIVVKFDSIIPEKAMDPYEVFNKSGKYILLEEAENQIVKESLVPYPPGVPIISSGEIITKEIIKIIGKYIEVGHTVIGVKDRKIKII